MPEPTVKVRIEEDDLIIARMDALSRPGGQKRSSGFLLYRLAPWMIYIHGVFYWLVLWNVSEYHASVWLC